MYGLYGKMVKYVCKIYRNIYHIRHGKYYRVKNIFAENKIPYKDTSTNNQLRLSLNNVRGTNPALLRDSGVKNTYSISVKKEDEYKARQLIQGRV